ncbi:hypothetical protein IV417_14825 [Alphaproteobacteria bacterium KMM 3653]|uniref:Uncharacterized protein n=1 Tax=Harenicola maris TaxID=2841044 RepID=A0AAP2G967_9RHOB|nr:hypothetical protein [Harenicola maris]
MDIAYHLGVHCTDENRLYRCLMKNRAQLGNRGVIISGPGRYRPILREAISTLKGERASQEMQDTILAAILDTDKAERLVFSNEQFICADRGALKDGGIYADAGLKATWISNLFPEDNTSFYMAIRNPATLIPALYHRIGAEEDFLSYMTGVVPTDLRWSDTIASMRSNAPNAPVTVWCNEDTPLIWGEVLRAVGGFADEQNIHSEFDFHLTLMSQEGVTRLENYLQTHPPKTRGQRVRVLSAFLDKYASAEALEVELDLPGWTAELIADLTARYEEDCTRIAAMEDVTFIRP